MTYRNAAASLYAAKVETVEGTYNAPALSSSPTNVIAIDAPVAPDYDHAFKPVRGHTLRGKLSTTPDFPLTVRGKVYSWTKKAMVRGTGAIPTAGAPIELDAWFRSAAFAPTYDATGGAEKVTYNAVYSAPETISELYNEEGLEIHGAGARAELSMDWDVGGPLNVTHASQGRIVSVADVALPASPVFQSAEPPVAADMTTLSVDGYTAAVIRHFECALGNMISMRSGAGAVGGVQGHRWGGRAPTFKIILEGGLIADKDWRALMQTNASVALAWTIGGTQYNKADFSAASARISKVTPSNDAGLALITLEGTLHGTDPLIFAIK